MTVHILAGDIVDQAHRIDDESIDLVFTSSPFWRQRAYLPDGHPDKHHEIGTGATLAASSTGSSTSSKPSPPNSPPTGSMMRGLVDTMAGSGGVGGDYNPGGNRHGQPRYN